MKLVSDWRKALTLRYLSSQAHALQVAIVGTWLGLPADMRAAVPVKYVLAAVAVAGLGGFIGRMIDQSPKPDDTDSAGA